MNPISVHQFSTYRWSFFEDVLQYSKHGFNSIGLWRSKVDDFGHVEAIDLLHEMKMSVSSVHWAGGFTGGDGRSFESAIDDAKDAIRLASEVRANCLIVHPGSRNSHTATHSRRLITKALEILVPFANDFDVCLALEPMTCGSFRDWTFLDDFAETIQLISGYPAETIGIVLDLFHIGNRQSVAEALPHLIDRVKLVQLADKNGEIPREDNRCSLGKGRIAISSWLNLLTQSGYESAFEIELHGFDMECIEYARMLRTSFGFLTGCLKSLESADSRFVDSTPIIESIE